MALANLFRSESASAAMNATATAQTLVAKQAPEEAAGASGGATTGVKLTKAQLEEVKKQVRPFMPFKEAGTKLFTALGPPHGKDEAKSTIFWRAGEGDQCAMLTVEKQGDEVGAVGITGCR